MRPISRRHIDASDCIWNGGRAGDGSSRIGGAQKTTPVHPGKGGSPHVRTEWTIDGANLSIEYGQPSLKGRTDAALMPTASPGAWAQTKRPC